MQDSPATDPPDDKPVVEADPLHGPRITVRVRVLVKAGDAAALGARVSLRALAHSGDAEIDWRKPPAWQPAGSAVTDGAGEAVVEVELATDAEGKRVVQATASQDGYGTGYSGEATVSAYDKSPLLTIDLSAATVVLGRVVDDEQKPIADARVMIFGLYVSQHRAIAAQHTGADGRFRFEGLPTVRLMYEVRADGFAMRRAWNHQFTPRAGEHDLGDIELARTGTVIGRLLDGEGNGIPGASVFLREVPTDWSAQQSTQSAADGSFSFDTVYGGAGTYVLVARAVGFAMGVVDELTVAAGKTTDVGDIKLARGFTLTVTVSDAGGEPIPAALVRVISDNEHFDVGHTWQVGNLRAVADATGVAFIPGLNAGSWRLIVSADGFARFLGKVELQQDLPHAVTLQRGGVVSGRLVDWRLQPAPDAVVGLVAHTHWVYTEFKEGKLPFQGFNWTRTTTRPVLRTDAEGAFRITDLPAGDFMLVALDAAEKRLLVHDNVRVQAGAETSLGQLTIPGVGSLTVELSENGVPLEGVRVLLLGVGYRKYAETGAAGQAVFADLAPGEYSVSLGSENFDREGLRPPGRTARVEPEAAATLKLTLPEEGAARVWGRMTINSEPVFINVTLFGHGVTYQANPDHEGAYSFPSVRAGEYEMRLHTRNSSFSLPLTVGAEPLEVTRDFAGVEVSGKVLLPGGTPAGGLQVSILGVGIGVRRGGQDEALTSQDGAFRFTNVLNGRWRVGVASEKGAAHTDVQVDGTSIDGITLKLSPAGSVVVVIRKLIGDTGISGHTARLRGADGELMVAGEGFMPVDGARAVLEGVPAGEYTLELIGYGYCCRFIKGVVVKAGERKEVEIDLPAAATARIELSGEDLTPAKVAAGKVEWQDAKGEVIALPWPYGITSQDGGTTLEIPDLIPEVTRIVIRVPGYTDAVVPFTFAPDAKVSLQATLEPAP